MKELLTKAFWQGVKKTFDEGLEGPPKALDAGPLPVEHQSNTASNPKPPPSLEESPEILTNPVK